jgi:putative NADH-flavin reductase
MKIVIFGASGATGTVLVAQALDAGHHVTAFVRTPSKLEITHTALQVVQGDVKDSAAVETAIVGNDVVLSALGVGRPLRHDPAVIEGIRNVTRVMEQSGPTRLIYQSFLAWPKAEHKSALCSGKSWPR